MYWRGSTLYRGVKRFGGVTAGSAMHDAGCFVQGITFVNEYALVRSLGKGSFGTVKLALNTTNHELVALKLIPKSRKRRHSIADGSPHYAEANVLQEITVMKSLSHPNIVRLIEVVGEPCTRALFLFGRCSCMRLHRLSNNAREMAQ